MNETNCLLQIAQVQTLQNPSTTTFQAEREFHQKWNFLRLIEEIYFRQKSKINWLREGDLITTYFRAFLIGTNHWITEPQEMSEHAVSHFQSVLGPTNHYHPGIISPPHWFTELTGFIFPQDHYQQMLLLSTTEEIRSCIFKLNANKEPGLDGLTSAFFKVSWETVGNEVVVSIKNFFASAFLPSTANATILTLVPKFSGASKITEFRPISCLNTIYIVISRLMVKRLKPILPSLILPSQTAFVKGRLLMENTTLAGELLNGYHKNKGQKKITIKADIAKAFDTLFWDFLFSCLQASSFHLVSSISSKHASALHPTW